MKYFRKSIQKYLFSEILILKERSFKISIIFQKRKHIKNKEKIQGKPYTTKKKTERTAKNSNNT
jgi:hypothetical protein